MSASYPSAVKSFTAKNTSDTIQASHVDDLQDEVTAIEQDLITGVPVARGGTGNTTLTANRVLLGNGASAIAVAGAGTAGQFFKSLGASAPAFGALTTPETTAVTGAQNDYDLDATFTILRCTGAAPVFTGFTVAGSAPSAGDLVVLECLGTTLKVSDQTGSSAANQIICDSTQGQIVGVNGMILCIYDGTTTRWRASLLEAGAPVAFTPTWTAASVNPAIGNGTLAGKYVQRGKNVWCEFILIAGSTTTFGSGVYSFALPLTAADAQRVRLSGEIFDSGTAFWAAWSRPDGTTTTVIVGSTGSTSANTSDSAPMTWVDTDRLVLGGQYQIT